MNGFFWPLVIIREFTKVHTANHPESDAFMLIYNRKLKPLEACICMPKTQIESLDPGKKRSRGDLRRFFIVLVFRYYRK